MATFTCHKFWILIFATFVYLHSVNSAEQCYRGLKLIPLKGSSGSKVCEDCEPRTFMPAEVHTNDHCFPCTEITDPTKERVVSPCNKTHDAEIQCIEGYYWPKATGPTTQASCTKCRTCAVQKRPCQGSKNTECCPGENYRVYRDESGQPVCERLCEHGQFLHLKSDQCKPCGEKTYMDENRHIHRYCKKCESPSSPNERIVQACNRTHAAVIGCVEGFYRKQQSDISTPAAACVPCSDCSKNTDGRPYLGRKCDQSHDIVCCVQPYMTVVDTPEGPECDHINKFSGDDKSKEDQGNSAGTLIGTVLVAVVIGTVLQMLVFAGCVLFYRRYRRSKKRGPGVKTEMEKLLTKRDEADSDVTGLATSYTTEDSELTSEKPIALEDFQPENVPKKYRDPDNKMVDLVKCQADLTVHVSVSRPSTKRPSHIPDIDQPYPHFGDRNINKPHTGSGWVERVITHEDRSCGVCPCADCEKSTKSKESWGEVVICTATQVVFNLEEGKDTTCHFFFSDTHNGDQQTFSVHRAVKVLSDEERDWCYMTFVTHDFKLLNRLDETNLKYQRLRREVKHKHGVIPQPAGGERSDDVLPKLCQRFKKSLTLLEEHKKDIQENWDKKPLRQSYAMTAYGYKLHDKSRGLGSLFDAGASEDEKKNKIVKILSTVGNKYSLCKQNVEQLMKEREQSAEKKT